ncbi:MAG: ABC transporter ATP-binding protein [Pseudomonadota bacterium]|nr:ABC transporter ATP-binding protein [Pseudomonadota bacterium]
MALLEVSGLRTRFTTDAGSFYAVDGLGFALDSGRTLAIVGESGSGKSVTALSIMGLVQKPAGRIEAGSIRFEGRELVGLPEAELQALRGNGMAMIFQEPMSSLNPAFTIGQQIVEGLQRHHRIGRVDAEARALQMLRRVHIPAPEERLHSYPHKLSGGMRQRAMIAMALINAPRLLIADEPTTALDVTIQAQILELMATLQRESGTAIVLITHDLGVVAEVADEVVVMYCGRIVERAPVQMLFSEPQHPYTVGLLGSMPRLHGRQDRLAAIEGQVPSPLRRPAGCNFADRCPFAVAKCHVEAPPLVDVGPDHAAACWLAPLDADALLSRRRESAIDTA